MSKNKLLRLLPILLAIALLFTVSVFATFAEGEDESADETSETSETSEAASSEEEASEAASEEASDDASASKEASSEAVTEYSAPAESSEAQKQSSTSNIPWKLIITIAVIVVVVAVLFILAKTNSKPGQRIAKFFKDYKSEIKKISWLSRKDLVRSTLVVLAVLIAASIVIGLLDFAFSELVNLLSSIG